MWIMMFHKHPSFINKVDSLTVKGEANNFDLPLLLGEEASKCLYSAK